MKSKQKHKVFGYARVSTTRQADSGLSLSAQRQQIAEAQKELAKRQRLTVGKIYVDRAVSAASRGLIGRPEGKRLDAAAGDGDHVIFAKLDRGFRSLRDCVVTLEQWHKRGVTVHFLDLAVATDTPIGRLFIGLLASMAQWESERRGERLREAFAQLREQGFAPTGVRRLGWLLDEYHRLVPAKAERQVAHRIARLHDAKRPRSFKEIAAVLNEDQVPRLGRYGEDLGPGTWTHQAVGRLYRAYRSGWSKADWELRKESQKSN